MNKKPFRIALLCGGPSLERGISLNSARSVCDHLHSDGIEIVPIYFDHHKKAYFISRAQLYSNTPSDFDFKLATTAKQLTTTNLRGILEGVDLVFPVMHGTFGEDGGIQQILEEWRIPFIGAGSVSCQRAFDKYNANEYIRENGFYAPQTERLIKGDKKSVKKIEHFFYKNKVKRAIVKPANGGSSIAVYSVANANQAITAMKAIHEEVKADAVLEPFCKGIEFTVIVLQNKFGLPASVIPTEIELGYEDNQIFDYRRKYLATRQVTFHCPPRFSDTILETIGVQAEQLFSLFGMQDFARFDGWLLPSGEIWFSDFNPISGMEQNSFLFMQTARLGMSHRDILRYILSSACRRHNLEIPISLKRNVSNNAISIRVIFGGDTAERQVSLMSGTNVWLKLKRSGKYNPSPYLLDNQGSIWQIPYAFALNHTVEEIFEVCKSASQDIARLKLLVDRVKVKLAVPDSFFSEKIFLPKKMSVSKFLADTTPVFLAFHGGAGEDGTWQKKLEDRLIAFNGSGSVGSRLAMDKYLTGIAVNNLKINGIRTAKKIKVSIAKITKISVLWSELIKKLESTSIIAKPLGDGCSAGVVRLRNSQDLGKYLHFAKLGGATIPVGNFSKQTGIIEMSPHPLKEVLFEEFIETDKIELVDKELKITPISGFIEITVGVVTRNNQLNILNPSITVAEHDVLTLEEKFQGGTGVNITPPPPSIIPSNVIKGVKAKIKIVAEAINIYGYARIDAFVHRKTGELIIIEANTLPGLTPSTVIYHQALAEKPEMYPINFLEQIVDSGLRRYE
jgi:D-alanine--D-alanine ligase